MDEVWIGVDTGGTFTDFVLVHRDTGTYHYLKIPSSSNDPSRAILEGLEEVLRQAGSSADRVCLLVHGTTVCTNAVLQRRYARTGMLTTKGFRDILELARQRRPHLFNLDIPKPTPPAPRDCRLEVAERMGPDGAVIEDLSESDVDRAVRLLQEKGVEAIAICFLHSYANPLHEERARQLIQAAWPDVYVCTSSEVIAEFREYERFATATVNASVLPVMDIYLQNFEDGCQSLGVKVGPRVMQSNGGAVSAETVRRRPINTFLSGPAGGVIGAAGLAAQAGIRNLITLDMGGTSTDVCLVRDGVPVTRNVSDIGGFPVRGRALDIHTIGAGGGSIAYVDPGGLLKVGPDSAGADPGPAAYGRGGELPTVTDANILLGRLNPISLLEGRLPVYLERAKDAIERKLSRPLGISAFEAAAGVLQVVDANMMGAVRVISVQQGEDPRQYALVAYGGAGPLHAASVAAEIGIRTVLIPPRPGLLSAVGLLHADVRGDFSLTRLLTVSEKHVPGFQAALEELANQGYEWLKQEGLRETEVAFQWTADMRYVGQNFELPVPMSSGLLDEVELQRLVEEFHRVHEKAYGYRLDEQPVEIVNLRLRVVGRRPAVPAKADHDAHRPMQPVARRSVWFPKYGFIETSVYHRAALRPGVTLEGPVIVEQMDATTVVPPEAAVHMDSSGNLVMELTGGAAQGEEMSA